VGDASHAVRICRMGIQHYEQQPAHRSHQTFLWCIVWTSHILRRLLPACSLLGQLEGVAAFPICGPSLKWVGKSLPLSVNVRGCVRCETATAPLCLVLRESGL